MNIQIITSSYPSYPDDPAGTAGLFVREFALALAEMGHKVVVQPTGRKTTYSEEPGITIAPTPWLGGDQELASMSFWKPGNWKVFFHFFRDGCKKTSEINKNFSIDRTLCMWVVPSGIFGWFGKLKEGIPYDVWALGSDIWRIRKIPFLGGKVLSNLIRNADHVYADGIRLCEDVENISGVKCHFLPSSRRLPPPDKTIPPLDPEGRVHLLFTGRYHANKGPDLLLETMGHLPRNVRDHVWLHMFGFGPLEDRLKNLIATMGLEDCTSLGGPIKAQDFSNYLKNVSFLVIPSRIESIPVVLSDALQMGTPAITTPVGDLPMVINRFQCGLVAKNMSAEALALALAEGIKKGKDFFSDGVRKASEKFSLIDAAKTFIGK